MISKPWRLQSGKGLCFRFCASIKWLLISIASEVPKSINLSGCCPQIQLSDLNPPSIGPPACESPGREWQQTNAWWMPSDRILKPWTVAATYCEDDMETTVKQSATRVRNGMGTVDNWITMGFILSLKNNVFLLHAMRTLETPDCPWRQPITQKARDMPSQNLEERHTP